MIQRVLAFVAETLVCFQNVVDSSNEACIVASGGFFESLGKAILSISPFIDDLESVMKKSILSYAKDRATASLAYINGFCQYFTDVGPPERELERLREALSSLATSIHASAPQSDFALGCELVCDSVKYSDGKVLSLLSDLKSITAILESVHLTQKDPQSLVVVVSCLKIRVALMNSEQLQEDPELCERLGQGEANLNDLVVVVQSEWRASHFEGLDNGIPKWKDSIARMILNLADLRKTFSVLLERPILSITVDSYFRKLIDALKFFDGSVQRGFDVSHVYYQVIGRLTETRQFIWTCVRSYFPPPRFASLPFFDTGLDFSRFRDSFTRISPTHDFFHSIAVVVARLLDVRVQESMNYCFEVAEFVIDVNIQIVASLAGELDWTHLTTTVEKRITSLSAHGLEQEPLIL
jgi:hypothetical protein